MSAGSLAASLLLPGRKGVRDSVEHVLMCGASRILNVALQQERRLDADAINHVDHTLLPRPYLVLVHDVRPADSCLDVPDATASFRIGHAPRQRHVCDSHLKVPEDGQSVGAANCHGARLCICRGEEETNGKDVGEGVKSARLHIANVHGAKAEMKASRCAQDKSCHVISVLLAHKE